MITPLHGSFVQGKGGLRRRMQLAVSGRGRVVFARREGGGLPSRANRSRFLPPMAQAEGWTRVGHTPRVPMQGRMKTDSY
jgi:hypothetical protein